MRIWVISDLHISQKDAISLLKPNRFPEADVCVIAGDICNSMHLSVNWAGKVIRPHMPVIWIPGNHEFYDTSIFGGIKNSSMIAQAQDVTMLHNSSAVIGGTRFVGSTLWTDFNLDGDPNFSMDFCATGMADYSNIYFNEQMGSELPRLLEPSDTVELHRMAVHAIENELLKTFDGPTVVVSHHAPHPLSIHQKYHGDQCNPAFASDLTRLINRTQPDVWIHGHVHTCFDYFAGKTRIVCNPRGYGLENEDFDFFKVIEIQASV